MHLTFWLKIAKIQLAASICGTFISLTIQSSDMTVHKWECIIHILFSFTCLASYNCCVFRPVFGCYPHIKASRNINTVSYAIIFNSNTIELTLCTSCYLGLRLTLCYNIYFQSSTNDKQYLLQNYCQGLNRHFNNKKIISYSRKRFILDMLHLYHIHYCPWFAQE